MHTRVNVKCASILPLLVLQFRYTIRCEMRADKWKKIHRNHYSTQAIQLTAQWNFTTFCVWVKFMKIFITFFCSFQLFLLLNIQNIIVCSLVQNASLIAIKSLQKTEVLGKLCGIEIYTQHKQQQQQKQRTRKLFVANAK